MLKPETGDIRERVRAVASPFFGTRLCFRKGAKLFFKIVRATPARSGPALAMRMAGTQCNRLAEQGLEVLSIDFSPLAQAKARALAAERGVKVNFELADVHTWQYPEAAFDVVVEIFTSLAPRMSAN